MNKRFGTISIFLSIILLTSAMFMGGCSSSSELPKVSLSVWAGEQDQELVQTMVDSFVEKYKDQANFTITVCEESEGSCKDTVLFCPEAAADVYTFADDQFTDLALAGALYKVTDDVDNIIAENGGADSAAIAAVSKDGDIYAYPATASNGYFLYYNANYFTEDEVLSLETIMDKAMESGKYFGMEFTSGWYLYGFFTAAGLDVHMNEDGTTNYCDWANNNGKYTGTDVAKSLLRIATHKAMANVGNDDLVKGVQDGRIIACISGTWNEEFIREAYGDGYRACKLPTFNVNGDNLQIHSVAGYKLVGVNAYTDEPDWACLLARWITNEENQLLRFKVRGEGPSNINAAKSDEVLASPAIAALVSQSEYGHLQRVAGCYWNATYRFGNTLASGTVEEKDMKAIINDLVKEIEGK